jgi:hypothetical protein
MHLFFQRPFSRIRGRGPIHTDLREKKENRERSLKTKMHPYLTHKYLKTHRK